MVREMTIGDRRIGAGQPSFIIAEAGVNHNGDLDLARGLVDAAAEAGVDAVKFQTWITEKICRPGARKAPYQEANDSAGADQFEMLKKLELPFAWHAELKTRAEQRGLVFLSTPDEIESARFLCELGVTALKIGSGEVTNLPYLRALGALGRPLILSTGMSDVAEVSAAYSALGGCKGAPVALLHCVSAYPAPEAEMNLRCIATLRETFGVPAGLSDHTEGEFAAIVAVGLGMAVLEKHLTLDRTLPGPDHAASLEPGSFATLVRAVRRAEALLGTGQKQMTTSERDTRHAVARTLVYARDLAAGSVVRAPDFEALRSGVAGLGTDVLDQLVGRTLATGVAGGALVRTEDFR